MMIFLLGERSDSCANTCPQLFKDDRSRVGACARSRYVVVRSPSHLDIAEPRLVAFTNSLPKDEMAGFPYDATISWT